MKKILIGSVLFSFSALSWAGSAYIAPSLVYQSITAGNVSYQGITPQFALGYGNDFAITRFYGAIEAFVGPRSLTINSHTQHILSLKPKYNFGISFLPGYMIDENIMLYVRLGEIWTNFSDLNATKPGGQVGAGIQVFFDAKWGIRGEYDYMRYHSLTGLGRLQTGQYVVSAVYCFN